MNNERQPTEAAPPPRRPARGADALSASAVERRRLLLKGLGRGGAVVAAAVPINSFATLQTQKLITLTRMQCSVSGQYSSVHSASPNVSPECGGNKIATWVNRAKSGWPALPNGCTPDTPCLSVFSGCTLTVWDVSQLIPRLRAATLWEVVSSPLLCNTEDAHWVCAWLNACGPTTLNFPYTPEEVLAFYNARNRSALSFFQSFTERW